MKFWPRNKVGRIVAFFCYCLLVFAVIGLFGGLKSSFQRGAGISTASPVGQASHQSAPKVTITASANTPSPHPTPTVVDHVHCVVFGTKGASATLEKDGDLPVKFKAPGDVREVLNEKASVYTCAVALNGSGDATVKLFINGHLMSTAAATGGYNTAITTIVHNQYGVWVGAGGNN